MTTLPSTLTSPPVGVSWPRMQLNSVDLPQPFGPIRPRISPSCTSKETPSTAWMPPKLFLMLADFEDRGHGAVSSLDFGDRAQRGRRLGAALGQIAVEDAENAGRRIDQQQHHDDRIEHQIIALREAQPFRQQHGDHRAEERPEEKAGAADDHHHQQIERERQRERHRIDVLRQRRIERAGDAAERRADRKRHQRVAPRVDAERQRAHRIFAQRHEGAAPGRADQPPHRQRDDAERAEAEIIERQRPVGGEAEDIRPRNVADAVDALGEPVLVAEHQKRQRRERQRDEGEIMMLHAQRRIAEHPADREAQHDRDAERCNQRQAMRGHDRRCIGADADEGALRQRDLAGIAERQVEAHRGDGHHRPVAQDEEAVAVEVQRHDDQRRRSPRRRARCARYLPAPVIPCAPRGGRAGPADGTG